jgi:hypothetical protein
MQVTDEGELCVLPAGCSTEVVKSQPGRVSRNS